MSLEAELQRLTENDTPQRKAHFASIIQSSLRQWDQFMREDPELAKIEIGIAHCARILVTEPYSSPQYAQAVIEERRLSDRRLALLLARADAKARRA